jgi:ribosomal protein L4
MCTRVYESGSEHVQSAGEAAHVLVLLWRRPIDGAERLGGTRKPGTHLGTMAFGDTSEVTAFWI